METRREYALLVVKLLPTLLTSTAKKKFQVDYECSLSEVMHGLHILYFSGAGLLMSFQDTCGASRVLSLLQPTAPAFTANCIFVSLYIYIYSCLDFYLC